MSTTTSTRRTSRGFTLVELIVSIGIFTFMTTLVVVKYGNFNSSVLLTDAAYEVALAVRTAQTYGVSVKQTDTSTSFQHAYGINATVTTSSNQNIVLYADMDDNGYYSPDSVLNPDVVVSTYILKKGALVYDICTGTDSASCSSGTTAIDISFKRPNPSAIIHPGTCTSYPSCSYPTTGSAYGRITLRSPDGSTRDIDIYKNGQISIGN